MQIACSQINTGKSGGVARVSIGTKRGNSGFEVKQIVSIVRNSLRGLMKALRQVQRVGARLGFGLRQCWLLG